MSCKELFDQTMIQANLSDVHSFKCDVHSAIEFGLSLPFAAQCLASRKEQFTYHGIKDSSHPVWMYIKREFLKHVIFKQPVSGSLQSQEERSFESRLISGCKTIKVYEEPSQQAIARSHVDFQKIREYTQYHYHSNMEREGVPLAEDIAFLTALLQWFKCDFFKWCNKPECANETCKAKPMHMEAVGVTEPSAEERDVGWAGRTEVYRCNQCQQITRFPRFNNPGHLLKTRRGRCGEWANAFCLVCR